MPSADEAQDGEATTTESRKPSRRREPNRDEQGTTRKSFQPRLRKKRRDPNRKEQGTLREEQ